MRADDIDMLRTMRRIARTGGRIDQLRAEQAAERRQSEAQRIRERRRDRRRAWLLILAELGAVLLLFAVVIGAVYIGHGVGLSGLP